MSLRIRYQYPRGSSLGYSIERLADGLFYDFTSAKFTASPATLVAPLPEDSGSFIGRYKVTLSPTPSSQFTDGDYVVTVHNLASSQVVLAEMAVVMRNGDDATVLPVADPWALSLPGSYPAGSAGAILGGNLDAKVSTRSIYAGGPVASVTAPVTVGSNGDKTGYSLAAAGIADPWATVLPGSYPAGSAGALLGGNLDAKVSTRSTFAGGPVASVTAPVTVGSNGDKTGYSLAAAGLDAIAVETGVNARQALSPILAASAGVLLGSGTGTIVIKGGNTAVTRVTATVDNAGNRTAISLNIPT
jgi:hypothetical protein